MNIKNLENRYELAYKELKNKINVLKEEQKRQKSFPYEYVISHQIKERTITFTSNNIFFIFGLLKITFAFGLTIFYKNFEHDFFAFLLFVIYFFEYKRARDILHKNEGYLEYGFSKFIGFDEHITDATWQNTLFYFKFGGIIGIVVFLINYKIEFLHPILSRICETYFILASNINVDELVEFENK